MAINSLDGIIAGVKPPQFFTKSGSNTTVTGKPYSFWGVAGIPGAGSYDSTLSGVALSSTSGLVNGQIPYYNASSGKQMYLARAVGITSSSGIMFICDRLWHSGGLTITSTSAQTVNSATWPARDNNGTTNGEGILIGVEASTTLGAATPTFTMTYTNSAGTGSRTATNQTATSSAATAGNFFMMSLQAGDIGVRSIQSFQLSASYVSGTINLVAYRVLAVLEQPVSNLGVAVDPVTGGMVKLYDGTVPFIIQLPGGAANVRVAGQLIYTEG